jgi:hypothetical protein
LISRAADWFNQRLPDGGPVYLEQRCDFIIVEPWHAFSAMGAWFILAYLNRLKKFDPKHEYRTA